MSRRRKAGGKSRRSRSGRLGERSRSGQPRERSRSGRRRSCIGKPSEPGGRTRRDKKEVERHQERTQRDMKNEKYLEKDGLAVSSQRDLKTGQLVASKVEKESV